MLNSVIRQLSWTSSTDTAHASADMAVSCIVCRCCTCQ